MDDLPVAVFCKDASDGFRFVLWNKKQEEVTGISRMSALGNSDYDLFPERAADAFRRLDEHVILTGETINIPEEEVLPREATQSVWLRTVKTPVEDSANGRTLLLGVSEDITESKKLNESLSRTSEQLKQTQLQLIQAEKMDSIGRLAAGVAHEVKNPLALLLMGVEYLDSGLEPDDENLPEIISEMRQAINRADRIIRGLVDFSSSRQLDLQLQSVAPVIDEALLLSRHDLIRNSVEVSTHYEAELPKVMLDRGKLEQVLLNLLINAIHAMRDIEGPKLEIRVSIEQARNVATDEGARTAERVRSGDHVVLIEVADNGSGIPPEKITKLFDPFFTTKPTGVGTGLGLSVVSNIIELHKGTIDIQNRETAGACVRIRLRAASEAG